MIHITRRHVGVFAASSSYALIALIGIIGISRVLGNTSSPEIAAPAPTVTPSSDTPTPPTDRTPTIKPSAKPPSDSNPRDGGRGVMAAPLVSVKPVGHGGSRPTSGASSPITQPTPPSTPVSPSQAIVAVRVSLRAIQCDAVRVGNVVSAGGAC